ncbi:hypothetical protein [Ligilactobacillus salivarius]|nr:hypothetical protein [Ligilactobacillus salivarius]
MPLNLWHPHHNIITIMNTALLYVILAVVIVSKMIDFYLDNKIKKLKKEQEQLKKELDELKKKDK